MWRKLGSEERYALYLPNLVRVIRSRRLRRAGDVARMGERRGAYRGLVGKPELRKPLGRNTIILKWIFENWDLGGMD